MHSHSLIPGVGRWDGALSEGLGDFLSATITGDPAVGPGFFGDNSVLRHCDPDGREHVWPTDTGAIHHTGKIYCGAMFDLRKNLISSLGGRGRPSRHQSIVLRVVPPRVEHPNHVHRGPRGR